MPQTAQNSRYADFLDYAQLQYMFLGEVPLLFDLLKYFSCCKKASKLPFDVRYHRLRYNPPLSRAGRGRAGQGREQGRALLAGRTENRKVCIHGRARFRKNTKIRSGRAQKNREMGTTLLFGETNLELHCAIPLAVLLLCSFSQGSNNLGALFVLLRRSWKETTGLTSRGSRGLLDTFGRRCTAWSLTYIGWQAARVEFFFRSGIPCAFQPLTAPTPAYINQQQEEREGDYCTAVHAARSSHNRQPLLAPSCLTPTDR